MNNLNLLLGMIIVLAVLIAVLSNLNNKPVLLNGSLILASALLTALLMRYFLSKRK